MSIPIQNQNKVNQENAVLKKINDLGPKIKSYKVENNKENKDKPNIKKVSNWTDYGWRDSHNFRDHFGDAN